VRIKAIIIMHLWTHQ